MRIAASVGEMMRARDEIAVVTVDASVRQVVDVMVKARVEGVLVVDGRGRVVGSIGDEQLVRRANEGPARPWCRHDEPDEGILDLGAGEVMLTRVVPVNTDVPLLSAVRLLDEYAVNVLPVLDERHRLVGALFRCDLVKQLFCPGARTGIAS